MNILPNLLFVPFVILHWWKLEHPASAKTRLLPRIDGVDASAFMLGKSDTTGSDSYLFFGTDGELLSIKWKIYKTIFRYTETPALDLVTVIPDMVYI